MTDAHIVLGMAHSIYNKTEVQVMYKDKLVLLRGRGTNTGLWLSPIAKKNTDHQEKSTAYTTHEIHASKLLQFANSNISETNPK